MCAWILLCAAVMFPNSNTFTVKKSNVWTLLIFKWLGDFEGYDVAQMMLVYNFTRYRSSLIVSLWPSLYECQYCPRSTRKLFLLQTVSFHIRSFILFHFLFFSSKIGWLGKSKEEHSSVSIIWAGRRFESSKYFLDFLTFSRSHRRK